MGRAKRGKRIRKPTEDEEEYSSDEGLNQESDDFFHDEVDKFHKNREKIMLEEEQKSDEEVSDDDNENIMGLDLEESEDEADDDTDEGSEEEESDEESKLPSDKSWGKKKSTFYDADTADADVGSEEETWELEKQEEEAALVLQQRMAAALDEDDFDVANFQIPVDEEKDDDIEEKKTVAMDLSKLSKEQKLEILFRDSPELFELLEDFKTKLEEITSVLSPLIQIAKLGNLPPEGAKYLELKHQLYLNYCINISFYLLMKARQTPVKGHPVIERIVQYRTLIKELEPLDKELESDIEILLANKEELLKQSETIKESLTEKMGKHSEVKKKLKKKQKKFSKAETKISALLDESDNEDIQEEENEPPKKKTKKKNHEGHPDPLEYYEKVRLEKKRAKEIKNMAARLAREPGFEEDDMEENEDMKRAITYQISKNKGLTAKKKKQERNPRVKHRKKYTKAVIKRKSQVRPVVTETNRYEGEKSGIRAFLTRSVKIK
ncbi:something about silencing protein 10-like [Actinia tenebrosa]|uniref:Something about silencing protein 10-like n=1 Tax=Actinia tenebrosa TaxID=6105 RepID=A0A6P8IT60_ACTTE|nr:something about silencing protein 10-like [Actinia tenebrosa]